MKINRYAYCLLGLVTLLALSSSQIMAQGVAVGETNAAPDPSAMLDVQSVTKGMLIPRMNAVQRLAIAAPANGLMVFQIANDSPGGIWMPRGFWYWDGGQSKWIHLGDERTGKVDQAAATIESTLGDAFVPVPDPGQNDLIWAPVYIDPPTVLVIPEFTAVATPPAITDYCQPTVLNCNSFRPRYVFLYHPNTIIGNFASPPLMAAMTHNNCTGANDVNYKFLPYPTGTAYVNTSTSVNIGTIDLCTGPYELGVFINNYNTTARSFRFYIDKNQDGDFADPGEDMGAFINQPPTANPTASSYVWGTGNPTYLPPLPIPADIVDGVTKFRVIMRQAPTLANTPCYAGDSQTFIYDIDVNIACGGGGAPFYPNDLNWCNVDDVTSTSARVSCFDKDGAASDTKYHYKIISHD